jgi:hypothetical protein
MDYTEKHFCIDAGKGEKMEGCPYSFYEDGHDVEEYIIPPKGYIFTGFKLQLMPDNQIYDGKLIAQYEKEPLKERMTSVLQVVIWVLIICIIIGLITVLAIGVFKPQKPQNQVIEQPQGENPFIPIDTVAETDTATFEAMDTTALSVPQTPESQSISSDTIQPKPTEQPILTDDNALFKQEFWALIHERNAMMDSYDGLYKQYKGKVSGEEYDYLRYTILKDSPSYIEWIGKLRKIPSGEIEAIESIATLKSKIKEIN